MVTHDEADARATGGRILTIGTDPVAIRTDGGPPTLSGIAAPR
jgi:hypothetical protein